MIGLIDGVHVYIEAPPRNMRPEQYVGRSGKMSINNQMVCDHTGRITNLVSKWPGENLFLSYKIIVGCCSSWS